MRTATASVIELLETQVEYLENLNRRLEALADWAVLYPKYLAEISAVYDQGIKLGQQLRYIEVEKENTKEINDVIQIHNIFILRYDTLWRTIQGT